MMLKMMKEHKLLTEVLWVPLHSTTHAQRTRAITSLLARQYRVVAYKVNSGKETSDGRDDKPSLEYRGMVEQHASVWEPLALYIRLLYGDGIFYSRNDAGMVWLLIIYEGVIVPGTDSLICSSVFDSLMEDRKYSQYKALPIRELLEDSAEEILAHYQTNQQRLKKKRYFFYATLVCIGLVLLAIPVVFILIG